MAEEEVRTGMTEGERARLENAERRILCLEQENTLYREITRVLIQNIDYHGNIYISQREKEHLRILWQRLSR